LWPSCWRNACDCAASDCASASASARISANSFLAPGQRGALSDALFALGLGEAALLLDGQHAPLQVGMEPVDALEGRLRAAPSLFKAGQFRSHLRSFLLQPSRFCAKGQLRLQLIERSLGLRVLCFKPRQSLRAFARWSALGFARVLVARGLQAVHSCRRRSTR
jgi:hypothetical protein